MDLHPSRAAPSHTARVKRSLWKAPVAGVPSVTTSAIRKRTNDTVSMPDIDRRRGEGRVDQIPHPVLDLDHPAEALDRHPLSLGARHRPGDTGPEADGLPDLGGRHRGVVHERWSVTKSPAHPRGRVVLLCHADLQRVHF